MNVPNKYIAIISACRPQFVNDECNAVDPTPNKHAANANVVAYILLDVIRLFLGLIFVAEVVVSEEGGNNNTQFGMLSNRV